MDYIELKAGGDKVIVPLAKIAYVIANGDAGSIVALDGGADLNVEETYQMVRNRIDKANQALAEALMGEDV